MNMVFEIRGCDIIPVRVRLTKNYRVHSCAVRDERIWVCGSRDDPFSCESYDEEFNMKDEGYTLFPHSYSAMVHNHRGLTLLGGISQSSGRHESVEHYQNGAWTRGPSLPDKISSHSAHDLDGDIFVLGGLNADLGVMGQSAQVYRLARDAVKWTTMPPLLRPRSHHASVALANGGIFLVGDPYSVAPVQIYANNQTETLSVEHKARAFPAAIHLSRPIC